MRGIEAQFLALQKGFNELIPQHLLKPFDQKELEVCAPLARQIGVKGLKCDQCLWFTPWLQGGAGADSQLAQELVRAPRGTRGQSARGVQDV